MKKILSLVLVFAMSIACLTACGKEVTPESQATPTVAPTATSTPTNTPVPEDTSLKKAIEYIYTLYKSSEEVSETPSDYKVMGVAKVGTTLYTVNWTSDNDQVKVGAMDADKKVLIDVNEKTETPIVYTLTASITSDRGETKSVTFKHSVPAYKVSSYNEYAAAAKDQVVVCRGTITAFLTKSAPLSNTSNSIYFQDANGGYYAYNLSQDPVTELGLKIGQKIEIAGTKDTYSGTYEIMSGVVEVLDANVNAVTPADYTEIALKAADNKDAALVEKQSFLVTLKDVEITDFDASSGYYNFTIGNVKSYIRISSSSCPVDKTAQTAIINSHKEHTGYIADVTGLVCVYSGAFYLTPVSADAFSNFRLPKKSDAEMVAYESDLLTVADIAEDSTITLSATGKTYTDDVKVTWALEEAACATLTDGKLTVVLPEEATTIKLTATITAGAETATKEFTVKVDAASTEVYVAENATTPVAGVAYKFALEQAQLGQTLYFAGAMDGNYFAATDKAEKAVNVFVETVEGGYRLYFNDGDVKKYLDIYVYDTANNKVGVQLTDTPTCVYTWNEELSIFVTNVGGADRYLGTYNKNARISASEIKYITGDNASKVGVSQFPAHIVTLAPAQVKAVAPATYEAGKAYKFALNQAQVGKTLYFAGAMNGNYFAVTDKVNKATDVYLETVEGGYRMYFNDGDVKKYLDIYVYDTANNKVGIQLTDTPTCVYTWNEELGVFAANVGGADRYLGTYNSNERISASETKYISGDNASKVGVSQFPAFLANVVNEKLAIATEVSTEKTYKLALAQNAVGKTLYFAGTMNGNYFAATDKSAKAADVFAEEVEGGYRFFFNDAEGKKYIDIYVYDTANNKVGVQITATPTAVYTWNAELNIFTANVGGADRYLGTYNKNEKISASEIKYITGDNAAKVGISQFPAQLYIVK